MGFEALRVQNMTLRLHYLNVLLYCFKYLIPFLRCEALHHIGFSNLFKIERILFLKFRTSPSIKSKTKTSKLLMDSTWSLLLTQNWLFFVPKFPHTVFYCKNNIKVIFHLNCGLTAYYSHSVLRRSQFDIHGAFHFSGINFQPFLLEMSSKISLKEGMGKLLKANFIRNLWC